MKKQVDIRSVLKKVSPNEFERFCEEHQRKWLNTKGRKYIERVIKIVKEYAENVDIAGDFREEWNSSHYASQWYTYNDTQPKTKFASTVDYKIDGNKVTIFNNAKAQRPMWKANKPVEDGDLSDWIEGDGENSYIHPVPPYYKDHLGRKIFKAWFEKSEWMKMWYKADPYFLKAFQDKRMATIEEEMFSDWAIDLRDSIIKKWGS